jgi:glycosyltransferase involved in cell wall biosynthesis
VAGDGPQKGRLAARAAASPHHGRVHFLGHKPHDEMAAVLAASDAYVIPTLRHEGLPYAAIEAAQMALPAIATTRAGVREVFGRGAAYADPGDVRALSLAFDDMARAPRAQWGQANKARAQDLFSEPRAREQIQRTLKEIL